MYFGKATISDVVRLTTVIFPIDPPGVERATLRTSSRPPDSSFAHSPHEGNADGSEPKGSLALFVDGQDTGIRVPKGYQARLASNRRGDLAGSLAYTFDGAYLGTVSRTFAKPLGGRWRLLAVPVGHDSLAFAGIDERGRVLTLAEEYFLGPGVDNPTYGLSHAILWSGGRPQDLGVFDTAAFAPDGSVVGSLWIDDKDRPVNGIMQEMPGWHRVAVRWQDGRRVLGATIPTEGRTVDSRPRVSPT